MARASGHYWTWEGFLMDDLFNGTGIDSTVYADRHLVVTRTKNPFGVRFAGEIDASNSAAVGRSIRAVFTDDARPHLDLTRLSFCDVSGVRALVQAAHKVGDGTRLLLHGLPTQLQTVVRDEARRSHELVAAGGTERASEAFRGLDESGARLSPAPDHSTWIVFDLERLVAVRRMVSRFAVNAGLSSSRATELATAVNEVATNSVVHGGGEGTLRLWRDGTTLLCEVSDAGRHASLRGDVVSPKPNVVGGRGLWMANQLCDLVQIRTSEDGTVVRLHTKA